MGLGAVMIAFAAGLLAYNAWDENRANAEAAVLMPGLLAQIDAAGTGPSGTKESEQAVIDTDLNTSELPADPYSQIEKLLANDELDTVEIDGTSYIGYLSIPGLDLELPVISEWSYPNLKISPARYRESNQTHGLIIAGHNYSRHFGKLNILSVGDPILFTDIHGTTYHFKVSLIQVLAPDDVEGMLSGDWDLTMFTCTYGGASRVTVRCVYDEAI